MGKTARAKARGSTLEWNMYKFFLTLRYLRKRRIAYFAIMAVALCVAMVLVVHSVMSGFLDTVRNSSRRLLGDVILEVGSMESFPFYDEFIAELHEQMGDRIVAATPVIINAGLLKLQGGLEMVRTYMVYINGIRLETYARINSFGDGLYYDEHFPGTTTFADAPMPMWYYDDHDLPRLADEYEEPLARYQEKTGHPKITGKHVRLPGQPYPGPGYFQRYWEGEDEDRTQSGEPLPGLIVGVEMVTSELKETNRLS